ncbi:hypothetical protein OAI77_00820 [Candidatus Nitrosopelagicus sp.]|nr:hypothetical protein [Candidatus Nitrosopelagicus sp.]
MQIVHVQIGVVIPEKSAEEDIDKYYVTRRNYLLDFEFAVNRLDDEHMLYGFEDKKSDSHYYWDENWKRVEPPRTFFFKPFNTNEKAYLISTIHPTKRAKQEDPDDQIVYRLWSAGLYKAVNDVGYPIYEKELEKEHDESKSTFNAVMKGYEKEHSERTKDSIPKMTYFLWNIEKYSEPEYKMGLESDYNITCDYFEDYGRFLPEKTCFEKEIPQRNSPYPRNYSKWRARVKTIGINEYKPYVVKYDVIESTGVSGIYLPPMCLEHSEE